MSDIYKHSKYKRIPKHIGIIPDGNRRWAENNNMEKGMGYEYGIQPGFRLYELLIKEGVEEATFYGFTKDNTKRPKAQTEKYTKACIEAVDTLSNKDANLFVVGNTDSVFFPEELKPYANKRVPFGKGLININFLVNYDWGWDLSAVMDTQNKVNSRKEIKESICSKDISKIDLIIRWGGRRRLSGFLPVQSVYSDFYVLDDMWPDFKDSNLYEALDWYQDCDITLGG